MLLLLAFLMLLHLTPHGASLMLADSRQCAAPGTGRHRRRSRHAADPRRIYRRTR